MKRKSPSQRRIRAALKATEQFPLKFLEAIARGEHALIPFSDGEADCPVHGDRLTCEACQEADRPSSSGGRDNSPLGQILEAASQQFMEAETAVFQARTARLLDFIRKGGKIANPSQGN